MDAKSLLKYVVDAGASDLHLSAGVAPTVRVHGNIQPIPDQPKMTPEAIEAVLQALMSPDQWREFLAAGEIDFSFGIEGLGRFRINVFRQRGTPAVAIRAIANEIPSFEELGLPPILKQISALRDGLVLVTGPAGNGKSTTLAAMIDWINNNRSAVVITLEDPIEYLHRHKRSIVNQREVGGDTHSFAAGLRAALREDPDVILVGEMRDTETMEVAIRAAETGHLVLSTLHTNDAASAVARLLDLGVEPFLVSSSLSAVLAQRLVRKVHPECRGGGCDACLGTGFRGRTGVFELLVVDGRIRAMIGRRCSAQEIKEAACAHGGMVTLKEAGQRLVDAGVTTAAEVARVIEALDEEVVP